MMNIISKAEGVFYRLLLPIIITMLFILLALLMIWLARMILSAWGLVVMCRPL